MPKKEHIIPEKEKITLSRFACNLKLLRTIRGVSQQKLADTLHINRSNIASCEAGIVQPSAERFLAIARYFGVSPLVLATEDLSQHPTEHLPTSSPVLETKEISEKLDSLVLKTMDLQKVIEGFKIFYEVKKKHSSVNPDLLSLSNDFENLLSILENLLETNWNFLQDIQKKEDSSE